LSNKRPYEKPALPEFPGGKWVAALLIAYVAFVLTADTLATLRVAWPFAWADWFAWRPKHLAPYLLPLVPGESLDRAVAGFLLSPRTNQLDLFKLTIWFLVPVLVSWRFMDWGAWGWNRWRGRDWALLALAGIGGVVAVMLIPYIPGVSELYRPATRLSTGQKVLVVAGYHLWCLSWLPGWEFLHRYVLLAALGKFFPRHGWGWLVVPLLIASSEAAYHLVKPWPETLAMFGFGMAASLWAYQRGNFLLPFLAHYLIELALVLFIVLNS
jgi:hypothetical protein